MHKHETGKTSITVERISVTTIRTRRNSQKLYCEVCRQELTQGDLASSPMLLNGQTQARELADETGSSTENK